MVLQMRPVQVHFAELKGTIEAEEDLMITREELLRKHKIFSIPHDLARDKATSFACLRIKRLIDEWVVW